MAYNITIIPTGVLNYSSSWKMEYLKYDFANVNVLRHLDGVRFLGEDGSVVVAVGYRDVDNCLTAERRYSLVRGKH